MYEYLGPPLTRAALHALLDRLGVQPWAYSLYGAHEPEAIVLDHRASGWVVFYTERGEESGLRSHDNEDEACRDLLDRVTRWDQVFFQLVAGPSLPGEADDAFEAWLSERSIARSDLQPEDWKTQDSPWVAGEPDYRRYWVREVAVRRLTAS